jgi:hypothetical protein
MTQEELKKGIRVLNTFTKETGTVVGLGKHQVKVQNDNGTKTQHAIWYHLQTYVLI